MQFRRGSGRGRDASGPARRVPREACSAPARPAQRKSRSIRVIAPSPFETPEKSFDNRASYPAA